VTDLLQKAITELEKLPPDHQDALASRILAELADEDAWNKRFSATSDEQWDALAEIVRGQIAAGETASLDDVFPPHSSSS
jgi:hypothetical protein